MRLFLYIFSWVIPQTESSQKQTNTFLVANWAKYYIFLRFITYRIHRPPICCTSTVSHKKYLRFYLLTYYEYNHRTPLCCNKTRDILGIESIQDDPNAGIPGYLDKTFFTQLDNYYLLHYAFQMYWMIKKKKSIVK